MPVLIKTRTDLINRALEILGIISENRPAFPNEVIEVDSHIDGLIKDLAVREIAYVGDAEEIEIAQFEPLAFLLADLTANPFGLPGISPKDGTPAKLFYEQLLIDQNYGRPSYAPLQTDYY